jgi:hypothetical protein
MSSWMRSVHMERAFSAATAEELRLAAANEQLSKTEQNRLPAYLGNLAAQARQAKPKGAHLWITEVVSPVRRDLHERLLTHGVGAFTSLDEITKVAADADGLRPLLLRARELARAAATAEPPTRAEVLLVTDAPGITLQTTPEGFELRIAKTVPVGTPFELHLDGQVRGAATAPRGWNAYALAADLPEGLGVSGSLQREEADAFVAPFVATRDGKGSLSSDEARIAAQHALVELLKTSRTKQPDWRDLPTDWAGLVAAGVVRDLVGFGESAEIRRESDRYVLTGRGPLGIYAEVEIAKADGRALRTLIEID